MTTYKQKHPDFGKISQNLPRSLEARKAESQRILERYPDRIPVICEKAKSSKLPDIDKHK